MYRKETKGWMKHWDFMFLDICCLQIAFIIAYFIRHGLRFPYSNQVYRNMTFVFVFIQVFVTFFGESFKNVLKRGNYREFTCTFRHVCIVMLISSFYLFATQTGEVYSRLTLLFTGILYLTVSYIGRVLLKRRLKAKGVGLTGKRSLLIITAEHMVETVVENIKNNNYAGFHVTGIALMDAGKIGEMVDGVSIVADTKTVVDYVCREWVDEIFINLPYEMALPGKLLNDFIEMGVTVHIRLLEIANISGQKQKIEKLGTYTVWTSSINMATWKQVFYKRTLDVMGGMIGCLITGILFLLVAPFIYIQSPGPIFFSQTRVGKNGKKFKMYKFRSMYLDAEERKKELMAQNRVKDGRMFKLDHDPRIIGGEKGIGGIIRKYSIDEFPQFWNVLKGDMSIVGTRPPTVDEWERYELHHRARLAIKPGVTGLWQVSGRSRITDFEEVVKLDREYITNWSLGMDMKIIMRTILVMVGENGAM